MKATNYHKPSMATLTAGLSIDNATAAKARALMAGAVRITGNPDFPATNRWLDQCFNPPNRLELILSALNELLECHGVESIWSKRDELRPVAEYLNTGDTYAPTLLFFRPSTSFRVTSWGDFVETNQTRLNLK